MQSSVFLSNFRVLEATYYTTQVQSHQWLVEAHTAAEETKAKNGSVSFDADVFRSKMTKAVEHYGCAATQIAGRGVQVPDFMHVNWHQMEIYRLDEAPQGAGMFSRSEYFERAATGAFEQLFADAEQPPNDILHVTCTGYTSPSAAQRFVSSKGWGAHSRVTHAYQMGCYAAFPALRIAAGFALAEDARSVDVVHTEICSLHLNPLAHTPEQLVIQTLFADGFIAYSVGIANRTQVQPTLELLSLDEQLISDSADVMRWVTSDWGMHMTLSRDVPARLVQVLSPFIDGLCARAGISKAEQKQACFAVHPGGPKIIEGVRALAGLSREQTRHSQAVLHTSGNMSSATVPHVWFRMLEDATVPSGQIIISLAFGPGLTVSGAVMRKVGP
jgi:predicted naringenin-chalcone synthase